MKSNKQGPWSKRRTSLSAGESTVLGLASGIAVAVAASLNPPRDFTFSFLVLLLCSIGLFGAISGYGAWLISQPLKFEKIQKIATCLALISIAGLFIRLPNVWQEIGRAMGVSMIVTFMGFIFSMSFFIVIAGYGIVQLIAHYIGTERSFGESAKPGMAGGMRDHELDF